MMQICNPTLVYTCASISIQLLNILYLRCKSHSELFVGSCTVLATKNSSLVTWTCKHCPNADKYIERGESSKCKGQHGEKFSKKKTLQV